jgi:8-oxo-dGTP diphosphatase
MHLGLLKNQTKSANATNSIGCILMPIPEYLRVLRKHIGHAPVVMCGVMAVVLNEHNEVLIQRRSDNGKWGLPGGIMDPGEEPAPATIREVFEETGLHVQIERLVAVHSGAEQFILYPNGDQVMFLNFGVVCRVVGGLLRVNDDESTEVRFVPTADVPYMNANQSDYVVMALQDNPHTEFRMITARGRGKGATLMPISDYIRTMREKISHDLLMMIGVAGVIRNESGELLLQLRSDTGRWGLPGGAVDPGEEPADALVREVLEETGLTVLPECIVGVYSGEDYRFCYPNGDEVCVMNITFACRVLEGIPTVNDDESLEVRYFSPDALPQMESRTHDRIIQALKNDAQTEFRR